MTWCGKPAPTAPTKLTLDGNTLSWQGAQDRSGGLHLFYNIYASPYFPVDISKAENIVGIRLQQTTYLVPANGLNYAVTAMDRYGQESEPKQLKLVENSRPETTEHHVNVEGAVPFYTVSSQSPTFQLPAKPSTLDAQFIMIETLQGKNVSVQPFTTHLNLRGIPNGIYQLRSLGRKGRNHRLGILYIEK